VDSDFSVLGSAFPGFICCRETFYQFDSNYIEYK
jgi:hypothetical protein